MTVSRFQEHVSRLLALAQDPHPGLATWQQFAQRTIHVFVREWETSVGITPDDTPEVQP